MNTTTVNLVPDTQNPTPDYYCTWQTQLYATCGGTPEQQRQLINEHSLFDTEKPFGWVNFHKEARRDLFLVMDDSWDVPPDGDSRFYGSLLLNREKFPEAVGSADSNAAALKHLVERVRSYGWKGLGGWICAQESPVLGDETPDTEYWISRLREMHTAGFAYWKVDWGEKMSSLPFRKMLTDLARQYAPNLVMEHAMLPTVIPHCDVFRTYDVPALMSIPMTLEKLAALKEAPTPDDPLRGLINCEDEAYIAAAGGYAMGIMRHPFVGPFVNGNPDRSFPAIHRNIKTKQYEVIRAARWHRIAPAFSGGCMQLSDEQLTDRWRFEDISNELEPFWLESPPFVEHLAGDWLSRSAPADLARNTDLPRVTPTASGDRPYTVSSLNPNGVFSIATLGRTADRRYFLPPCEVAVTIGSARTVGVFGEYRTLVLEADRPAERVLLQDLAADTAWDITDCVRQKEGRLHIPGDCLSRIGTAAQPLEDTSEPGAVLQLIG